MRQITGTALTASSTSFRDQVLNAIGNASSPPALAISIKPTIKSAVADTRSDLLTMSAQMEIEAITDFRPPLGRCFTMLRTAMGGSRLSYTTLTLRTNFGW